ncbi:DUF423 domain-containing protein [Devosia sp.]|uniref:DUF423 domain-containing protein n=1 Tax=Devosia sp. TaxID=1871048 RepID=UPI003A8CCD54
MARPHLVIAGLSGVLGVGLSALASHQADSNLAIAGNFLLIHAPALLALGIIREPRLAGITAYVMAAGLALFAGDLAMRSLADHALFPFAAPIGGGLLILGWCGVAITGVSRR